MQNFIIKADIKILGLSINNVNLETLLHSAFPSGNTAKMRIMKTRQSSTVAY